MHQILSQGGKKMGKDVASELAEFAIRTKYEDIPKAVLEYGKQLTLKTVSGVLAGSAKPSGRKLTQIIKEKKLSEQVGVMGTGFRTSLWESVFLQTYYAHNAELEDDRFAKGMGVTWDITVIPLLFPLAEMLNLSGRAFLEALITGLEVTVRTGMFSARHLGIGQIPGAIGPAVTACRALGLNTKETAGAMGLAMSNAAISVTNYSTDAHYLESALISLQAIIAAEMAQKGLAGNPDLATFLTSFLGKDKVVPEKMVEDLGKRWDFCEIWIKKYPACFLQHRQIDSVIEMRKEHNLSYDDVKVIEVHTNLAEKILDRPEPKNEGDIQFSYQHSLSAALLDGDVNLDHICENAVHDPRLKEARSKVKIVYHPEFSIEFNQAPSKVVIKMKDGREFSRERQFPIGDPKHHPLTPEQVRGLFAKFSKGILKEKEIGKVADMIWHIEDLNSLKELINILVQRP
jgi:2-methylcitrate dehydratase PrpD